jgi:lactobin A/cerein 7B family class IIb bacteriocin
MFSANNESVGFSAVGQEEMEAVNGGVAPLVVAGIVVAAAAVTAGCQNPMLPSREELKSNSNSSSSSSSSSGGGGK